MDQKNNMPSGAEKNIAENIKKFEIAGAQDIPENYDDKKSVPREQTIIDIPPVEETDKSGGSLGTGN